MRRLPPLVWLVVAVILGGTATLMSRSWLARRPPAPAAAVKMAPVVVAATDIDAGATLAAKQLKIKEMPQDKIPKGSFARFEEVKDRITTSSYKEGEPILDTQLEPRPSGILARVSPNKRAMTVKVDEVSGVAGFLSPGDRVDVVATITPKEAGKESISKVVLQNLRVLSTGQRIDKVPGEKPQVVPTVTLEVTPAEGERLALSSREGQITLVLRGQRDQLAVDTPGVNALRLLDEKEGEAAHHQVEVIRRLQRESLKF